MQAIVLAAGLARRMRPLSNSVHKALIPVGGTTILGRIVEELESAGVRDIVVVTGYLADDVATYLCREYPRISFTFVHNDRYAETNNVVSLALGLEHISPGHDILLAECDLLLARGLLAGLISRESGNVALVDRYRTGMDGTVVTVDDGFVTNVITPERQSAAFLYGDTYKTLNVYRFDENYCVKTLGPLVAWYADRVDASCYYEQVLGMLCSAPGSRIAAELVGEQAWAEVDDPNDLAAARFTFETGRRAEILDRAMGGRWSFDVTDFGFMQNAHFPPAGMLAMLRHALPQLVSNYGSAQPVLNEKLSWFLNCAPDRLQMLHGASQGLQIFADMIAARRPLIPSPSFGEYARLFPGACCYRDSPGTDPDEIEGSVRKSDLVVFVNPNNPTGTVTPSAYILDLARRNRDTTFLVDESFIEFSDQKSLVGQLDDDLRNVVVVSSMSKTLGASGLRMGFVYSTDTALVKQIGERLPIWNLSSPAEYFLELLLKFRVELRDSIRRTIDDRSQFAAALTELAGVAQVYPSGGNFLLARLDVNAANASAIRGRMLVEHRVDFKDVSHRFDDGRVRIRVGVRSSQDNQGFVDALGRVLSGRR